VSYAHRAEWAGSDVLGFDKGAMKAKLSGIFAALVTPRDRQGRVNYGTFDCLVDFVLERGIDGLVVCGATGEYPHLELKERKKLIARAVKRSPRNMTVMACIGASSIYTTLKLGEHALEAGSRALLLPAPHFFHYEQHDLVTFCKIVARTLQAPCVLYNLPSFTNRFDTDTSIQLLVAEKHIIGIKDSSGDRQSLVRFAQARPKDGFSLIVGHDALIWDALAAGWDGIVSGIACFLPELLVSYYRGFRAGESETTCRCRALVHQLTEEINKLPIPWGIRLGLDIRGIPTGPLPLPLSAARKREIAQFRDWLRRWLPEHDVASLAATQ